MIKYVLLMMVMAVPALAEDGKELLKNASFKDGLEPWIFVYHRNEYGVLKPPRISRPATGDGSPVVSMVNPSSTGRHYMRLDYDIDLVEGKSYKFTVEVRYKGKVEGHFWSGVQMKRFPHKNYGLHAKCPVSPQWQRYESLFTMKPVDSENPPCLRLYCGELKGVTDIRNCSLVEISEGPFKLTQTTVTALEKAPVVKPKNYTAVEVDLETMANAFARSAPSATKEYSGKILAIEGQITGTGKSIKPGTFALELNYGAVRAIVGGNEFGTGDFEELEKNIREVRKALREAEKEAKKKKNYVKISSSEQKEQELKAYPTLRCDGKFAFFRSKVIEISPTRAVDVSLATP